jgi:hypothetical protein
MFVGSKEYFTGIFSVTNVGRDTESEEIQMSLSKYKELAGIAVSEW